MSMLQQDARLVGRNLADDELCTPIIRPHSLEKYSRHNYLASLFANSMKRKWRHRAYIGLYAGAGRAKLEGTGEIIETPALAVLRQPFTHYVYVDNDPECVGALAQRATAFQTENPPTFIPGDVNDHVMDIKKALPPPPYSRENGLLSLCFVDPFSAKLKFETIRSLARFKMDFLILLALGHDVRRNFRMYYEDRTDTRIAELIDCPHWRDEYRRSGKNIIRFVLEKFGEKMVELKYQPPEPKHYHAVKVGGVLLYFLVLYSKHKLGQEFWSSTLANVDPQQALPL